MKKVKVKLGWRRTQDGDIPRIGKPGPDMREWPGQYLFHDVEKTDSGVVFKFVDREEEVFDTPSIRRAILDGHLIAVDSELKALNQPDPNKPEPKPAEKKTNKRGRPRKQAAPNKESD